MKNVLPSNIAQYLVLCCYLRFFLAFFTFHVVKLGIKVIYSEYYLLTFAKKKNVYGKMLKISIVKRTGNQKFDLIFRFKT